MLSFGLPPDTIQGRNEQLKTLLINHATESLSSQDWLKDFTEKSAEYKARHEVFIALWWKSLRVLPGKQTKYEGRSCDML